MRQQLAGEPFDADNAKISGRSRPEIRPSSQVLTDKSFLDHVSDWFKILLRSGVPALMIGMGWVSTFFGGIWLSDSWSSGPAFWVVTGAGVMMILLGYKLHTAELKLPKYQEQE